MKKDTIVKKKQTRLERDIAAAEWRFGKLTKKQKEVIAKTPLSTVRKRIREGVKREKKEIIKKLSAHTNFVGINLGAKRHITVAELEYVLNRTRKAEKEVEQFRKSKGLTRKMDEKLYQIVGNIQRIAWELEPLIGGYNAGNGMGAYKRTGEDLLLDINRNFDDFVKEVENI